MGAQCVERIDLGLNALRNAENSNRFPTVAKLAAQRVLGLIAGQEHRVSAVADVMAQVVQNAARLAHSGRRDDNERAAEVVQFFRFVCVPDVGQALEAERIFAIFQILARLIVEALGMRAEDGSDVDRQRAVDKDRDGRKALRIHQTGGA